MARPPFNKFPVVSNDRVTLRPILHADLTELLQISFYNSIQATNLEEAIEMNSKINADYEAGNSIHWGIAENKSQVIVGTCGYYRGFANASGELGCVLLEQHQGKGLMRSAMELAIEFGLQNMQLQRIWAATSPQNQKAIKLLTALHFKQTRVLEDQDLEFEWAGEAK